MGLSIVLGYAFRKDGEEEHLQELQTLVTDIEEDENMRATTPNSKRKALYIAIAKCAGWVRSYPTRVICTTFAKCTQNVVNLTLCLWCWCMHADWTPIYGQPVYILGLCVLCHASMCKALAKVPTHVRSYPTLVLCARFQKYYENVVKLILCLWCWCMRADWTCEDSNPGICEVGGAPYAPLARRKVRGLLRTSSKASKKGVEIE
jgi:hypothetical protein